MGLDEVLCDPVGLAEELCDPVGFEELCDPVGLAEELCEPVGLDEGPWDAVDLEELCEDLDGLADELDFVGLADELDVPPSSHWHQDLISEDLSAPQSFLTQSLVASRILSMVAGWHAQLFVSGLQYFAASALTHLAAHWSLDALQVLVGFVALVVLLVGLVLLVGFVSSLSHLQNALTGVGQSVFGAHAPPVMQAAESLRIFSIVSCLQTQRTSLLFDPVQYLAVAVFRHCDAQLGIFCLRGSH